MRPDHARSQPPLLVTMGDPAGIGPEITTKAWQALRGDPKYIFAVIAPKPLYSDVPVTEIKHIRQARDVFATSLPILPLDPDSQGGEMIISHQADPQNAPAITASISRAVALALSGEAAAIITNPISKDILYKAGFQHAGHTEFLGALTRNAHDHGPYIQAPQARGPVMMLASGRHLPGGGLRVALATVHMSLKKATQSLTTDIILNRTRVLNAALQTDYGIPHPRIALTGLNPHAGEDGALGYEEQDIINPAAAILRAEGLTVTDAQPADTLFHAEARTGYDAVLAMYHDQGLIPVKTLDFHGGVNITLGLPIIRTSPDHGTAFNIAGHNKARAESLIAAIKTAREISDYRSAYAE